MDNMTQQNRGVKIKIFKAILRRDVCTFSEMSPYTCIKCSECNLSSRTTVCENGGKKPKWSQTLQLKYRPTKNMHPMPSSPNFQCLHHNSIKIEVFDSNDLVGSGTLSINQLLQPTNQISKSEEIIIDLNFKDKVVGKVFLYILDFYNQAKVDKENEDKTRKNMMDELDEKVKAELIKKIGLTMGIQNKSGILFQKSEQVTDGAIKSSTNDILNTSSLPNPQYNIPQSPSNVHQYPVIQNSNQANFGYPQQNYHSVPPMVPPQVPYPGQSPYPGQGPSYIRSQMVMQQIPQQYTVKINKNKGGRQQQPQANSWMRQMMGGNAI